MKLIHRRRFKTPEMTILQFNRCSELIEIAFQGNKIIGNRSYCLAVVHYFVLHGDSFYTCSSILHLAYHIHHRTVAYLWCGNEYSV